MRVRTLGVLKRSIPAERVLVGADGLAPALKNQDDNAVFSTLCDFWTPSNGYVDTTVERCKLVSTRAVALVLLCCCTKSSPGVVFLSHNFLPGVLIIMKRTITSCRLRRY